jgi:DNA modification methylase
MTVDPGLTVAMAKRIELWPLDRLKPYDRNARTHSAEQVAQIAASIVEFGFTNPILVDSNDGIIAGHGRLSAAQELGLKTVPVVVLDHLSERQRKAYILADNQLALNAGWDTDLLRGELQDLAELDFDLSLIGFSDDELADLLPEIEELPPEGADEDAAPEVPEEPVSKPGDVWLLGKHRVMCGDSTSLTEVDRLMDSAKAGLVFTDPPYGVEFRSNMSKRFDVLQNDDKILDIAPVVWDAMADNTAAFIWTSHHVYPVWRAQFEQFYKQTIVWHKGGGGMGDLEGQYALDYEMALFCAKGSPKFRGSRGMAVWQIAKDAAALYVHPTQKPVALAERAIADFSDKRAIVLDLFGGSGSTLIACEKTSRQARLMELDPRYCDVIVKRWQQFTGKTATLDATGERFPDDAA